MTSWAPLPNLVFGKVTKPFLPRKNITKSDNKTIFNNFRDIYPGDLVYLFETEENSKKWARGYVLAQPNPSDFSGSTISLDTLPESKISVSIIPLSHVKPIRELEITTTDDDFISADGAIIDDQYSYSEVSDELSLASSNLSHNQKRSKRPALPVNDIALSIENVAQEIELALKSLSVHIFALYTKGDMNHFKKLSEVFEELDNTRLNLKNGLLTTAEQLVAKKKCAYLLTMVSKYVAASNLVLVGHTLKSTSKDIPGYESILARHNESGELYVTKKTDYQETLANPAKIAQNQLFYALAPNFPVIDSDLTLFPPKTTKFSQAFPTHIMVDFKAVSGSSTVVPKGYAGMNAYMYLRNSKRRLTECFAIKISPDQDIFLDNLSAALFQNVPSNEIDTGRIYLVALLTETVHLEQSGSGTKNGIPNLKSIRKGVCAGAVDISRIFSRRKGHLTAGESHQFTMKLYASYMSEDTQPLQIYPGMNPMLAMSMAMANNGWGELVDRIISGSNKGVAINPRAEQMIISVKELKIDTINSEENTLNVIDSIRTLSYNPIEKDYDRIYLRGIRTINVPTPRGKPFITVELRSSSKTLKFSKGSNETGKSTWQFLSTSPEEYISELIQVTGLAPVPTNENDYLYFDVYVSGEFIGEGRYPLRVFNQISDTGIYTKKVKTIDLFSPTSTTSVGSVEIDLEYVGKNYNVDTYIEMVLNWRSIFEKNITNTDKNLIATLGKVKRAGLSTIIKFFPDLMFQLLEIYGLACDKHQILSVYGSTRETKFQTLADSVFECIVHLLDITLARQDQYVVLLDHLFERVLPKVGESLVADTNKFLASFEAEWNSTSRAICRVAPMLLRIGAHCYSDMSHFIAGSTQFCTNITDFLKSDKEVFVSDQLVLIETLELIHECLNGISDPLKLGGYVIDWTNAIGLRGLGSMEDLSSNALVNKRKSKEHKLILMKLLLLTRSLRGPFFGNLAPEIRLVFYKNALSHSLEILLHKTIDMDASRLSLGLILACLNSSFGEEKSGEDAADAFIIYCRIFPLLCEVFNRYFEYVKSKKLLKPRRTFTQLFPPTYPFREFTMDSTVHDESFSEVLMEFTVVLIILSKITIAHKEGVKQVYALGEKYSDFFDDMAKYVGGPLDYLTNPNKPLQTNRAIREMIHPTYYPGAKWITLKALANDAFQEYLATSVKIIYLPPPEQAEKFNKQFWTDFLVANLKCATSKPASLEHLSLIPKKACFNITGDIRSRTAKSLYETWKKLGWEATEEQKQRFGVERFGGYQKRLYSDDEYSFISELLLVCLQRNENCLEYGRKIFWSIIASEWVDRQSLYELEREVISGLYDVFLNTQRYTPGLREIKNFVSGLRTDAKLDIEDEAYQPVMQFIETMFQFLSTAAELKSIPEGEEFDDDRTFHKINISGYLMNVDKPELLQSFINSMYESNLEKNNFVQAALSLELLANTYNWDASAYLPSCAAPRFPSQSEFKRKEALYRLMAANFTKGGKIEQAVECYQELLDAYNKYNFDLSGLSFCHGELCKSFKSLETVGRLESTYFKVSFIGYGFPVSNRGKEFIYEGMPFEHITSINHRLTRLFPGSRIISNEDEAKRLLSKIPFGKYLHIKTVVPSKSSDSSRLSFMTRQYVDNKNLNTFVSTRRIPGSTNVTNLWTEEMTYETHLTFPTLMNRSEIKNTATVRLSPIKNAVKSLIEKNEELSGLEFAIKQNLKDGIDASSISSSSMFNNLSRNLAGTVDSPVNGGVGQYRTFFTAKSEEPDFDLNVKYLKNCFNNLIGLLNRLLKLHEALIPLNLRPQHEVMVELFTKNFRIEIEELGLDVTSTLNLDQLLESLISTNIHSRNHRRRNNHMLMGHGDFESSSNFGTNSSFTREDDQSETSSVSGSATNLSVHSGNSTSRLSSGFGSLSGRSMAPSSNSGKRNALNYK